MNNKIRKLISSCAVGCSCLWLPVSAFADWTMADILEGISQKYESEITEEDLEECGILEEARDTLQRENERAEREKARIRELVPGCRRSSEAQLPPCIHRPGVLPITIAHPEESLENVRKYSLGRAVKAIYQSYVGRRYGIRVME